MLCSIRVRNKNVAFYAYVEGNALVQFSELGLSRRRTCRCLTRLLVLLPR